MTVTPFVVISSVSSSTLFAWWIVGSVNWNGSRMARAERNGGKNFLSISLDIPVNYLTFVRLRRCQNDFDLYLALQLWSTVLSDEPRISVISSYMNVNTFHSLHMSNSQFTSWIMDERCESILFVHRTLISLLLSCASAVGLEKALYSLESDCRRWKNTNTFRYLQSKFSSNK